MPKNTIQSFFSLLLILILTSGWLSPSAIFAIPLFSTNLSPSSHTSNSNTTGNSISSATNTPIKHLVVIVQEDISFDHYFGTYPNAKNPPGESHFSASPSTPTINGLNSSLLYQNPNSANPIRLDKNSLYTCSMDHNYTSEQLAYHGGANKFLEYAGPTSPPSCTTPQNKQLVMSYYDGNTVTALWNYAQHFAMGDNYFGTTYGPSVLGHINIISGNTHGAIIVNPIPPNETSTNDGHRIVNGTLIANRDPAYDDCSNHNFSVMAMEGKNIGDLLNSKNISWGWFSSGFTPSVKTADGQWLCAYNGIQSFNIFKGNNTPIDNFYPDVEPFQFYKDTSNPHHLSPASISMIGFTDQANHQYDLNHFWDAAESGNLPAVSFIKGPTFAQAHAGYSNPLGEQDFLVNTLNRIQTMPQWNDTAVIITYDDSGGWYDHVMPPIIGQSKDLQYDRLSGIGQCGNTSTSESPFHDRCGYGPRLPFLVVSPWSKINFVDHNLTDQSSIIRFIEDNWGLDRIGHNSYDSKAGSLLNIFDFTNGHYAQRLFLYPSNGTLLNTS
jgi:phospholipase C